jgi:hypothetical protein
MPESRAFLLSPAYCGGRRATYLLRPGSKLLLAQRLAEGTLSIGEAFAFMSGLYFRGKLAYAMRFAPDRVYVITPTRGLLRPETPVTPDIVREFAKVDVAADDRRYRRPLTQSLRSLIEEIGPDAPVVLLGSIATGKYVDVLKRALGPRLHFPLDFVGRGDMSRGGLMLRSAAAGIELEYTAFGSNVIRHGSRPPKLAPLPEAEARITRAMGHRP